MPASLPSHNLRTACSACASICPKHLITFIPDKTGFLYPVIQNPASCTNCGLCEKICPALKKTLPEQPVLKTFAASAKNTAELITSASGGAAAVISRAVISDGGVVFGVAYTNDFSRAEFRKAETETELEQFKGSKYIQADKNSIFKTVKEELKKPDRKNKPVLFIGLPCEIAGLKAYLGELSEQKKYNNLITIDLICFGATSPKVAEEYTKHLAKTHQTSITSFSVRYKKDGKWTPAYLRASFADGKEYLKPFYETEYGHAFNLLPRPSCSSCRYKGKHHSSDITIGDFWGCTEQDSYWNPHGVSVLFVHTEKGMMNIPNLLNHPHRSHEPLSPVQKNHRFRR